MSADERKGNFGELCPAGFTAGGICTRTATGNTQLFMPQSGVSPTARTPIPFNNLTAAGLTLSPAAVAIVGSPFYPLANSGNRLQFAQRILNNADQGDAKIDWTPTEEDRIFRRYSQQSVRNPTSDILVLNPHCVSNFTYPLKNGVIGWT